MCYQFQLSPEQLSQLDQPSGQSSARFSRSSAFSRGTRESMSAAGRVARRAVASVKRHTAHAFAVVASLALLALMSGSVMAQTPPPAYEPPDPGSIPGFINYTLLIQKLTEGIGTFLGPVIVFMFGLALVGMFVAWLLGRGRAKVA